jgi:hypothetical protein
MASREEELLQMVIAVRDQARAADPQKPAPTLEALLEHLLSTYAKVEVAVGDASYQELRGTLLGLALTSLATVVELDTYMASRPPPDHIQCEKCEKKAQQWTTKGNMLESLSAVCIEHGEPQA